MHYTIYKIEQYFPKYIDIESKLYKPHFISYSSQMKNMNGVTATYSTFYVF